MDPDELAGGPASKWGWGEPIYPPTRGHLGLGGLSWAAGKEDGASHPCHSGIPGSMPTLGTGWALGNIC